MPDALNQDSDPALRRISRKLMRFLERRLGIPLDLMVELFGKDRIGMTDNYLVIAAINFDEILPFGAAGIHNWSAEIGLDGLIHFRVPLKEVREAGGE
jgi:hypothetical protein